MDQTIANASSRLQELKLSPRISFESLASKRLEDRRIPTSGMREIFKPLETPKKRAYDMLSEFRNFEQGQIKSLSMNPQIIETWLTQTLQNAENLEIPGVILNRDHLNPLTRYGVGRNNLADVGLNNEEIDTIYRELFVYSVGFYSMITEVTTKVNAEYKAVAGLWKVFAILLENCCHIDYQLVVSSIEMENQFLLDEVRNQHTKQVQDLESQIDEMQKLSTTLQGQMETVESGRMQEKRRRIELEEELASKGSGYESEITMRLAFEQKLNMLYAVRNDLNKRLEEAEESILDFKDQGMRKDIKIKEIAREISNAEFEKYQVKEQLVSEKEKVNAQIEALKKGENNVRYAQWETAQVKNKLQTLTTTTQDVTRAETKLRLKQENYEKQAQLNTNFTEGLKYKMGKLEVTKKQLHKRIDELDKKLKSDPKIGRDLEQEIADLQERASLQQEINDRQKMKMLNFQTRCEQLVEENQRISFDYKTFEDKIKQQKKALKKKDQEHELASEARHTAEEVTDKDSILIRELRAEVEAGHKKKLEALGSVDTLQLEISMLNEQLDISKQKLEQETKSHEVQQRVLENKIGNQRQIVAEESRERKQWISKFQSEQKTCREHVNTIEQKQAKIVDLENKIVNFNKMLGMKDKMIDEQIESNKEIYKTLSDEKTVSLAYQRRIAGFESMMETIEAKAAAKIKNSEYQIEKLIEQQSIDKYRLQCSYEDVHSRAQEHYNDRREQTDKVKRLLAARDFLNNQVTIKLDEIKVLKESNNNYKEHNKLLSKNLESTIYRAETAEKNYKWSQKELDRVKNELSKLENRYGRLIYAIPDEFSGRNNPVKDMVEVLNECRERLAGKKGFEDQETQKDMEEWLVDGEVQTDTYDQLVEQIKAENRMLYIEAHTNAAMAAEGHPEQQTSGSSPSPSPERQHRRLDTRNKTILSKHAEEELLSPTPLADMNIPANSGYLLPVGPSETLRDMGSRLPTLTVTNVTNSNMFQGAPTGALFQVVTKKNQNRANLNSQKTEKRSKNSNLSPVPANRAGGTPILFNQRASASMTPIQLSELLPKFGDETMAEVEEGEDGPLTKRLRPGAIRKSAGQMADSGKSYLPPKTAIAGDTRRSGSRPGNRQSQDTSHRTSYDSFSSEHKRSHSASMEPKHLDNQRYMRVKELSANSDEDVITIPSPKPSDQSLPKIGFQVQPEVSFMEDKEPDTNRSYSRHGLSKKEYIETGIKAHLKQANSRNKDNFNFQT